MQGFWEIFGVVGGAILSIAFVYIKRPSFLRGIKGVLFCFAITAAIFLAQAWYFTAYNEGFSDSLQRFVGCRLWKSAPACSPAASTEQTAVLQRAAEGAQRPNTEIQSANQPTNAIQTMDAAVSAGSSCEDAQLDYSRSRHAREALTIDFFDRGPIDYNPATYDDLLKSCVAAIAEAQNSSNKKKLADLTYYKAILLWSANPIAANANLSEIVELMTSAANLGNMAASFDVGNIYWRGPRSVQSYKNAEKYLELAAVSGLGSAMLHLGSMLETGPEETRDLQKSCDWYERSAEAGTNAGRTAIGNCYATGNGRQLNYPVALSWYRPVAEQGWPDAQFMMGYVYCQAAAPIGDRKECKSWLKKAAQGGQRGAEEVARMFGISLTD